MSARARFWAIVALMAVTLALCAGMAVERIEDDLLTRAQTALAAGGLPFYGVTVEGRDVVLQGFVPSQEQADSIHTIVADIEGVRRVRDIMTVERVAAPRELGTPSAPVVVPARLRVQRLGDRLFVGGTVPDDGSAERLLRAARERFGDGNVTSSLQVRVDVGHPPWLDVPERIVELLGLASDNVRLVVEGGTGVLSGEASGPEDLVRLRQVTASIPGLDWRFELFSRTGPLSDGRDGR